MHRRGPLHSPSLFCIFCINPSSAEDSRAGQPLLFTSRYCSKICLRHTSCDRPKRIKAVPGCTPIGISTSVPDASRGILYLVLHIINPSFDGVVNPLIATNPCVLLTSATCQRTLLRDCPGGSSDVRVAPEYPYKPMMRKVA